MRYTIDHGVAFIEGTYEGGEIIGPLESELNHFFSSNQLKTLGDLKKRMADEIKVRGGNTLFNFKYGQKSTFWKSLVGMDDVYWYGSGIIAKLSPEELEQLT